MLHCEGAVLTPGIIMRRRRRTVMTRASLATIVEPHGFTPNIGDNTAVKKKGVGLNRHGSIFGDE